MATKIPFDEFESPLEIIANLGMIPPAKQASKIAGDFDDNLAEIVILAEDATCITAPIATSAGFRHRLGELVKDETILTNLSARKLHALYALIGGADESIRQRFSLEVARRRTTDPNNEYLQLLANELRNG